MTMREGDRWICSNPSCKCEILVLLSSNVPYGDHRSLEQQMHAVLRHAILLLSPQRICLLR